MKQWLTVKEISQELGVDEQTIRLWIRTKKLRAYQPGGKQYIVKREDLDNFLEESRTDKDEDEK